MPIDSPGPRLADCDRLYLALPAGWRTRGRELASLIEQTIIPAEQVEAFDPLPEWTTVDQPVVHSLVFSDQDIVKLVIVEFNETHSWEEVTALWGGIQRRRFRNGERGERTASVVIDPDGQYACDYGDIGDSQPRKLDKYEVWLRANRIDKRADLRERCRVYRQRYS